MSGGANQITLAKQIVDSDGHPQQCRLISFAKLHAHASSIAPPAVLPQPRLHGCS